MGYPLGWASEELSSTLSATRLSQYKQRMRSLLWSLPSTRRLIVPKNQANHTETRREDWGTPLDLYDSLNEYFDFAVDLAATEENALAPEYVVDFFKEDWKSMRDYENKWCWCNPPYGTKGVGEWVKHVVEVGCNCVMLIPASVGADWWQNVWNGAARICFVRGRLAFQGAPHGAMFDSALVVFRQLGECLTHVEDLEVQLAKHGNVVELWKLYEGDSDD
jgi:phage N-6-adenine-methyltransferase